MSENIRVRFAPSPTGDLHIGGVRTALFNWLYAKKEKGTFILRIEDTDEARSTDQSTSIIIDALNWLQLNWQEGPGNELPEYAPYYQMKRKELGIYQKYIDILIEKGFAYKCYCTPEEVEKMRQQALLSKLPPKYNGHCANLTEEEKQQKEKEGRTAVIRFKMPKEGNIEFNDIVRGHVSFDNSLLDDFVLMKANGVPTYNFACVVDDYLMKITHVVRGDDHISNTPRQLNIFKALGWAMPQFAHLSMILGSDGARLSKRHGHTSVLEYRREGYLREALINYLALLGWSTSDSQQLFEHDELIEKFSLDRCNSSPATFDLTKLLWMNGEYIRKKSVDEIYDLFMDWIKFTKQESIIENWDKTLLKKAIELEHEKIKLIKDIPALVEFFFKELEFDETAVNKVFLSEKTRDSAKIVLTETLNRLPKEELFTPESLEQFARNLAVEKEIKTGQVFHPIRVAVSGRTQGPSLFHMMEVMGKDEVLNRIQLTINKYFK
ncbi:MAG: glutamate--tRNA ligase [Endomicrobiaceae bacterium]|nr:glutamate--tRNA ligase [Endomicrobiaceae bacterium]